MKHTIEKEIEWKLDISRNGTLCIAGNGESAIIIDRKGNVIITRRGSDLGLKFAYQVPTE